MSEHPAISAGRVAVVTGAASGIGLAAAKRFVGMGMKVCMADVNGAALDRAAGEVAAAARRPGDVVAVVTDVGRYEDVVRLKERALAELGEVGVLMSNAGREEGGELFRPLERWRQIVEVNLWGVIHGIQAFTEPMLLQGTPCAIVSTGSKQGITTPPGNTAYNISKAGVKVATEALAHHLRGIDGCAVTAHLLIPGFTFTGLTRAHVQEKPAAAWLPEQVIDFMLPAMARGDFYILCPDNAVTREMDERRIQWAADDVIRNRPALSRWDPAFGEEFEAFMRG